MTTARCRPTWDLALDPLVSCKLCLGEYPVEQMTTIAQCQCIFCTLCLKQYVELLIKEGLETAISCPDAACPRQGHLQENEIECMVAAEIMQRYKKLQFERGRCPSVLAGHDFCDRIQGTWGTAFGG